MQNNNEYLPLVSIVITSYNRAHFIKQAIDSALAQTYPNIEIVISDNCSTDNTDAVITKYLSDKRIRYYRNETNIGMIPNFNKAFFELAKGEYITNLCSDDYLINENFITKAINIIKKYNNISILFAKHNAINEITREITERSLQARYDEEFQEGIDMFWRFPVAPYYSAGGTVFSSSHLKTNNIQFSGRVTGDVEFNLQLMLYGNACFLNEYVYSIRLHDDNASNTFKGIDFLEYSYLDIYKFIYNKALPVVNNKHLLDLWYEKLILKAMMTCIDTVIQTRSRKNLLSFTKLMMKKYRKLFLKFLRKHPRYLAKIILNK